MSKIGIIGTHGSGKTTWALKTAAALKSKDPSKRVGLLSEVVRECPFPVNNEVTEDTERWIVHSQFVREIEEVGRTDILVCDRTVLDGLAYAARAGFDYLVGSYLDMCLDWMMTYDQLFFARPQGLPVDDDFRDPDPTFQAEIDTILSGWITQFGIDTSAIGVVKKHD